MNGDGKITPADKYLTGKSPFADFTFGWNTFLQVGNFDLRTVWRASVGNYAFNNVKARYATLKFVTAYRKAATDTKDTNDVRTVEVIMMFHYDELQDLKLTFTLVVGTKTTYTFNKEFITSSSTGTEALVERLTALEKLVQGLDLSKTIVLE